MNYKWEYYIDDRQVSKAQMDDFLYTDATHTAYKQQAITCFSAADTQSGTARFCVFTK